MKNISHNVVQDLKVHFILNNYFSEKKNRAIYEIKWENIVQRGSPQMTIWRMGIARWIHKAKNTHSQCVILPAFPLQQWLHERGSMLRHTHITLPVLLRTAITSDR